MRRQPDPVVVFVGRPLTPPSVRLRNALHAVWQAVVKAVTVAANQLAGAVIAVGGVASAVAAYGFWQHTT